MSGNHLRARTAYSLPREGYPKKELTNSKARISSNAIISSSTLREKLTNLLTIRTNLNPYPTKLMLWSSTRVKIKT